MNNKKLSFMTLIRGIQEPKKSMVYENSFIELNEKRAINSRRYRELISKNRVKGLPGLRK